ncbi:MAG: YkgJ family cysteine cluster protein [Clostridiaceae bacterium]|nr:YkgJ family cysteine cluster protein [Clostridiaceae bacterium]
MECRLGCAACCIAPSISSAIPGMPNGKPAGVRCIQLSNDNKCKLFGEKRRPTVCSDLKPCDEMCGKTAKEAYLYLENLEKSTSVIGRSINSLIL